MGTVTFDVVWFIAYTHDHGPPHVHGKYGEIEVIVVLLPDGVALADRKDRIRPLNAKASHVTKVLKVAAQHHQQLVTLWRSSRAL